MKETTKKEHEQLLDMMQTLFDSDPYVGIFWFDEKELDLVHVTKQELRDARRIGDKIMCSGLHEDYWLKQYRKAPCQRFVRITVLRRLDNDTEGSNFL